MDQPPKQPRSKLIKHAQRFSKSQLIVFVLAFAIIGGYFLIRSFAAAAPIATIEAENLAPGAASSVPASGTNLALNKPATSSSVESGTSFTAASAFDGNTNTRWSSAYADPQWLEVDLGSSQAIASVTINWEAAYAKAFQIQTSNDGTNWTNIYSTTTGTGGNQVLSVSGSGRYVRMYATTRGTQWGDSIWEMGVYGPASSTASVSSVPTSTNLALNKPATSSSVESGTSFTAASAFDGNTTSTRWSSTYADPQWLEVDLGSSQTIASVVINWEAAYAKAFQIQLSNDGSTWTSVYSTTSGTGGNQTLSVSGSGRYVRMYATARATKWGDSIWEMGVYGSAAAPAPPAPSGSAVNLALNKPATSSSVESGTSLTAANAFDGNTTGTRWSSTYSDPQWLEVDLGSNQVISSVIIDWEAAYAKAFQIQTSTDNVNWTNIYSTTTGTGGNQTLSVSGSGRYVRMYATARGTQWGDSIWEMGVFGPGSTTVTSAPVTVISDSNASGGKALAFVGNATVSGQFSISAAATSITATARGVACNGTGANMVVSIDNSQVISTTTSASAWTAYNANVNLAAGSHTLSITFNNASSSTSCPINLFVDKVDVFGAATTAPNPAPTASISALPGSVTSGSASTLSWSSTNATSCTTSGAWSGTTIGLSGSKSTGALTNNSTYTITCTGAGGSATQSATVSVTPASTGGGGTGTGSTTVTPPTPPSAYNVPGGAQLVSTSAALISALSASGKHDIVLANGTYANGSAFNDPNSDSIYAQNLGGATLTAGITLGGNGGPGGGVIQGLVFNLSSSGPSSSGGEIETWGNSGVNATIDDCVFQGNKNVPMGLYAYNATGLIAQRDQFYNFTDEGIRASDNVTVAYGAQTPHINTITDIYINGVSYATPGASNGTAEAGLWVGHPVDNGVNRIEIHNVSWSGIESVNNSWNTTFSNLNINMSGPNEGPGVAVYMEHYTEHDIFTNFSMTGANTGFNGEWDDGVTGEGATHFTTIQNGTISAAGSNRSATVGVYLDEGTEAVTVTGVTFQGQSWAGIGYPANVGTDVFSNNTYQLGSGAVQTTTNNI